MHKREILAIRLILWISGIAFLALIISGRKISIFGSAIIIIVLSLFLLKSYITQETLKNHLKTKYCVAGFFLCGMIASSFFDRWIDSGMARSISDILGTEPRILIMICAVSGVLAATPILSLCISFYAEVAIKEYNNIKLGGG